MEPDTNVNSAGDDKSVSTTTAMTIKNEILDDHMVPATMTTTINESTSPVPFTSEAAENDQQWGRYRFGLFQLQNFSFNYFPMWQNISLNLANIY